MKRGAHLMTGEKWTIEDENMRCSVDQKIKRGVQLMTEENWQIVSWNVKSWLREHTHTHNNTKGSLKKKKKHLDGLSPQWGGGVSGRVHFSRFFYF